MHNLEMQLGRTTKWKYYVCLIFWKFTIRKATQASQQSLYELTCVVAKVFQQGMFYIGAEEDTLIADVKATSKNLLVHSEVRGPRDMIFLHRALMGIYSMLRKLHHFADYESIRRQYANRAISVQKNLTQDTSVFKDFDQKVEM